MGIKNKKGKRFQQQKKQQNKKNLSNEQLYQDFKALNEPMQNEFLQAEQMYENYIISKEWLMDLNNQKNRNFNNDIVNQDLLYTNNFDFKEVSLIEDNNFILLNELEVNYDYVLVTDDAFEFLQKKFQIYAIKKKFYLNQNFEFIDQQPSMTINIIFSENNQRQLVQLPLTNNKQKLLEILDQKNPETQIFLLDTKLELKDIFNQLENNKIYGMELKEDNYNFNKLKSVDILFINNSKKKLEGILEKSDIQGYCYNCGSIKELKLDCQCQVVAYCSIFCKYRDISQHKEFCKQKSNPLQDIKNFLKEKNENEGLVGIVNIGNSCYFNSLLQNLKQSINIKDLDKKAFDQNDNPLSLSFYWTMKQLLTTNESSITPWMFKYYLGEMNADYKYYQQNDVHECFISLIDGLKQSNDTLSNDFIKNFSGEQISKIECLQCKNSIDKKENFFNLSLPIKKLVQPDTIKFYEMNQISDQIQFCQNQQLQFQVPEKTSLFSELLTFVKKDGFLVFVNEKKMHKIITKKESTFQNFLTYTNDPKYKESSVFFYPTQNTDLKLLSFQLVENKPTNHSLLQIKNNISDLRFVEAKTDKEYMTNKQIILQVFEMLKDQIFELYDIKNTYDQAPDQFKEAVYCKLFDIDYYFKKFENLKQDETVPQGLRYKMYTLEQFKENQDSEEKNIKEQFNEAKNQYMKDLKNFKNQYDKIIPIDSKQRYELFYSHQSQDVCPNCKKKSHHSCELSFTNKQLQFKKHRIPLSIEFKHKHKMIQVLKNKSQFENEQKKQKMEVPIQKDITLKDCIDQFFQPEKVDFKCSCCNNNKSLIISIIEQYPQTLVIHLKRFQTVQNNQQIKQIKNEKKVAANFDMDIEGESYKLVGVINHHGEINSGHYTTYVLNKISEKWNFFNDEKVEIVSDLKRIISKDNYLLFYEKQNKEVLQLNQQQNIYFLMSQSSENFLYTDESSSRSNINKSRETKTISHFQFPVIIDTFDQLRKRDFIPFFKILYFKKLDKTIYMKYDKYGFNPIHYAISQENYHTVKILLDFDKDFFYSQSKFGQNCLMLAINQKNFDLIDLFLKKANLEYLNQKDNFGYDLWFYIVKNNSIQIFFYVLQYYLEQLNNNQSKTQNFPLFALTKNNLGQTLVHQACHSDSLFFVKLFLRFGADFLVKDNKNNTPIDIAMKNNSVKVITYLNKISTTPLLTQFYIKNKFEAIEYNFHPENLAKTMENYESKKLIYDCLWKENKKIYLTKSIYYWYQKYNIKYKIGLFFYTLWQVLAIYSIQKKLGTIEQIIFLIICLLCFFLTLTFFLSNKIFNKIQNQQKIIQGKELEQQILQKQENKSVLTKFLRQSSYYIKQKDYQLYLQSQDLNENIMNSMLQYFKTDFQEEINSQYYCSLCLIKKPQKTFHCRQINLCVKNYQFYSKFFSKVIFNENIHFYQLILIIHIIKAFLEISFLVSKKINKETEFGCLLYIVVTIFISIKLIIALFVQLVANLYGLTQHELIHPYQYPYLYITMNQKTYYQNNTNQDKFKNFIKFGKY